MYRIFCAALTVQVLAAGDLSAQGTFAWKIRGDTSGAPRGCSAAVGISAISAWFASFNAADSAEFLRSTAAPYRGRFVFSTGRFTPSEGFFVAHTYSELLPYVRSRWRRHERMTIQEVQFNRWRGRGLQFGPIYFLRSADDLGGKALPGIGKGEVWCNEGISVLSVAPRPAFDPGPGRPDPLVEGCYVANPALTYSATGKPEHGDSSWALVRLSAYGLTERPLLKDHFDRRSSWTFDHDSLRVTFSDGLVGWRLRLVRAADGWNGTATYMSDAFVPGRLPYQHPIKLRRVACRVPSARPH